MAHLKSILIDFKRCFIPGQFQLSCYDGEYVQKAEDHSLNKASQEELDKVCTSLENFKPLSVLDIGCNSGRPLDKVCQHFDAKGTGIDVNPLAIEKAQKDYPEKDFFIMKAKSFLSTTRRFIM